MKKVWFSWSTGKDSAYALYEMQKSPQFKVVGLLSTVTEDYNRVSMHSTRRALLEMQSEALGIPLNVLNIPINCSNEIYESRILEQINLAKASGVEDFGFGDLFLEDIRAYREKMLAPVDMRPHFPLWGRNTRELAHDMLRAGLEAYLTCIDTSKVPKEFAGRKFDQSLLDELPPNVDPCGENGEFHTFVTHAPNFRFRIPVEKGELRQDGNFVFCDFLPKG